MVMGKKEKIVGTVKFFRRAQVSVEGWKGALVRPN